VNLAEFELYVHKALNPMIEAIKKSYTNRKKPFAEYRSYDVAGHSGILWFELHEKRFILPPIHMFDIAIPISKVHGNWKVDNDYASCKADPSMIDDLREILPRWSKQMQKKLGIKGFEFSRYRLRF